MAVTDDSRSRRTPRARPVLDLPSERLLSLADELARRWAVALILIRPLDAVAGVPLETLIAEAPALCTGAIRALESDVELDRLTGRGVSGARADSAVARRLSIICGAVDQLQALDALEALRGVIWEALRDELREPQARLVGDACDRLACVCAEILAAALEAMPTLEAAGGHDAQARADASAADTGQTRELGELATATRTASAPWAGGEAVIVDERAEALDGSAVGEPASGRAEPLSVGPPVAPDMAPVEIAIRDARRDEGPAAWIGLIGAQLGRFEQDRLPFAVLLVELLEIERARRAGDPQELASMADQMERALTGALGAWSGSFTRERPGRCWLVAPETDLEGAALIAERLSRALASRTTHRGASLEVVIGTAVCPQAGREASELAAHADVGLYAARSRAHAAAVGASSPRREHPV